MNGPENAALPSYHHRPERDGKLLTLSLLHYYYTCLAGRISRIEYLIAIVSLYAVLFAVGLALTVFCTASLFSGNPFAFFGSMGIAGLVYLLLALATSIAALLAGAKRAHDRNKTGWFVLLYFVPLLNIWPFIELFFLPGTAGDNRYGNDPLARFGSAQAPPLHVRPETSLRVAPMAETATRPMPHGPARTKTPCSPRLMGTEGEYANATIPLDAAGIVMGRDAERCNLVLASTQVSRVHARVTFLADRALFQVEDLGSSNGVFVGAERVAGKRILKSGQSFRLGQTAAAFTVHCA